MKIAIGSDHAGYELKAKIIESLEKEGNEIINFGTDSGESTDYPDYAHPVAEGVSKNEFEFGVLICGSGNGINMTANKHQDIRSALCWETEIAELARLHNDANIVAIPARFISEELALKIVSTFLKTKFEGGRHERRVNKIKCQ